MYHFLKNHIFGTVCTLFFIFYLAFLMLIFFAPRVDLHNRGFVFCTKQMINNFHDCSSHRVWCSVKVIVKNNACDFKVIKDGFSLWLKGEQKTPWANYYFEPVLQDEPNTDDEELKAYYQEHLDLFADMEELNKNRIELEKQVDKIQDQAPQAPEEVEIKEEETTNEEQ